MTILNPIETLTTIHQAYLRYLKTSYPFQDRALQAQFEDAISQPGLLVKGPLLEAAPPFEQGRSIADLQRLGLLHPYFRELCSDALPFDRPLYRHQEQAIAHLIQDQRNVIVATGTGSGKTESFLLPIFHHLLAEKEAGTLEQPGVRALLLYPMNALANDQLRRLRQVLRAYPAITFGRYTGETQQEEKKAKERFYQQFPDENLLENEIISRERMRMTPPHILLTNYAMLEYQLLRPEDSELFNTETMGRHWRFIVLDEAHIYDGASGIEIAMLLRRLKERVVLSRPGILRCIATSATLGSDKNDYGLATTFAENLFGETFCWNPSDTRYQDVIDAQRVTREVPGEIWGLGQPELYRGLQQVLLTVSCENDELLAPLVEATTPFVPMFVLNEARRVFLYWQNQADVDDRQRTALDSFFYAILQGDQRIHQLQELLGQDPRFLDQIAGPIFPDQEQENAIELVVTLVSLAVRARSGPEATAVSLLPARYHAFARALEGVFACLNVQGHQKGSPRLFLDRHESCPECQSRVIELAACMRCGATYAVGHALIQYSYSDSKTGKREQVYEFRQLAESAHLNGIQPKYYLLNQTRVNIDDDELTELEEEKEELQEDSRLSLFCPQCGTLCTGTIARCGCGVPVYSFLELKPSKRAERSGKTEPHSCIHCGARSPSVIIHRFLTGQDAPASVLATALYQHLPSSADEEAQDFPGEGRKLLIFSDSRQDAAFFAPYLERTYNHVLYRRLIYQTLLNRHREDDYLRLQDLADFVYLEAEKAGMFHQWQSRREKTIQAKNWLMRELMPLDRRLSLEGVGLVQFRLVRPRRWQGPEFLHEAPWNLTEEESWVLLALLLDTLRQKGIMTHLEDVDPGNDFFAPRNREHYMREAESDSKSRVFSWRSGRNRNQRFDILQRLLAVCLPHLVEEEQKQAIMQALRSIWQHFMGQRSVWRDHLPSQSLGKIGVVYQLNHAFWEVVPIQAGHVLYCCQRCGNLTSLSLKKMCPTLGCEGKLVEVTQESLANEQNHYRTLYQQMRPLPLSAEEHTAQWTSDEAGKVQERFIRGETNILSCSTTFELGVDVGALQAVLMRNVPPTTANYVQRAGRAGRRTDSAAFIMTYAQRRSHDLTHYHHPERILAGHMSPPRIQLANEKIIRRHMQAVLISAFLREQWSGQQQKLVSLGDFFSPQSGLKSGTTLLTSFAQTHPVDVEQALRRIVPVDLHVQIGLQDWHWLCTQEQDGLLDLLEQVDGEVLGDLQLYQKAEAESAAQRDYHKSEHYRRVTLTIRSRSLLSFFASRNLLPKYGFPTDVVELKTNHIPEAAARLVQLERDLRVALAEYAPGSEVVAAKYIWTGGGLYKQPKKDWPIFTYRICKHCNRFVRKKFVDGESTISHCGCGEPFQMAEQTFIIPEFGFVAAPNTLRKTGESRPQRLYSSRIYFTEYKLDQEEEKHVVFQPVEGFTKAGIQISTYYSHFGKLALVNEGIEKRGFRICQSCGFAEIAPPPLSMQKRGRERAREHADPRTGKRCQGTISNHRLGHEFMTDVVTIRLDGYNGEADNQSLWYSLLYALLEGASQALTIRRDDLDGTLYFPTRNHPASLILFDNVPGGAGHVKRVHEEMRKVFLTAYERVNKECCGPETSCYECLRGYRNQPFHDELKRGKARDFLEYLLND